MKTLLLLLFPTLLYGQCEYSENKIDEFTGDTVKMTKPNKIAWGTRVFFSKTSINGIAIMSLIYQGQIGCVTDESYVTFKYVDGTTEKIYHMAGINCTSPGFTGLVKNGKEVEKIRIRFTDSRDIVVKDKDFLIDGMACVL